jgi:pimeloyl-ACP methyl ester carboxylesterase
MISEAPTFERDLHLEKDMVVAYWDQRGTGKSSRTDPSTINVARSCADVRAIVDLLCARLGVPGLDVVGLSLGGTFAALAAAHDPRRINRLVLVGVDVEMGESERYAYAFVTSEAIRRGDRRAQRQLQRIGAPPHDTAKKFLTRARWVVAYGGIHRRRGYWGYAWDIASRVLTSRHYSWAERISALRAIERTQELMLASTSQFDLRTDVPRLEVPVAFFQGRHDVGTNPAVVARYVETLEAPAGKSLVWFEDSAHLPYYEEPARFGEALRRALGLAIAPASDT